MKRWLKFGAIVVLGVFLIAFVAYWFYETSDAYTEQEQYAVYSAYLSQGLLTNDHDYGDGHGLLVILDHSVRAGAVHAFPLVSAKMNRDLQLQSLHSVHFDRRFSLPTAYKLVSSDKLVEKSGVIAELTPEERKASFGGYITLSRVSFDRTRTLALFYTEHLACSLCGGGNLVLMQKQQGQWKVIDDYSPWVS